MSSTSNQGDFKSIRAKFETDIQNNTLAPSRGRSPSSNGGSIPPGNRKVRTSFVSVDPSGRVAMANNINDGPEHAATTKERRPSFSLSEEHDKEAIHELKLTLSNEAERRGSIPGLKENIVPEQAILTSGLPTPIPELEETASPLDKVKAKQSGETKASKATTSKPGRISNTAPLKAPRQSLAKSSTTAKPTPKQTRQSTASSRPVPSHLLAPTASSAAKHESEPESRKSAAGSKPISLSSHLMAPTAASKARQEHEVSHTSGTSKPAMAAVKRERASLAPQTTASSSRRLLSRPSLAGRPNGTTTARATESKPAASSPTNKPASSTSSSFLERMSKPITTAVNKVHDKAEAKESDPKSPPRAKKAAPAAKSVPAVPAVKAAPKLANITPPAATTAPNPQSRPGATKAKETALENPKEAAIAKSKEVTPPKPGARASAPKPGQNSASKAAEQPTSATEASKPESAISKVSKATNNLVSRAVQSLDPKSSDSAESPVPAPETIAAPTLASAPHVQPTTANAEESVSPKEEEIPIPASIHKEATIEEVETAVEQESAKTVTPAVASPPVQTKSNALSAKEADIISTPERSAESKATIPSQMDGSSPLSASEWNAATLPLTPQREVESNGVKAPTPMTPVANGSNGRVLPITPDSNADHNQTNKNLERIAARKSMMETPTDLEGATIH